MSKRKNDLARWASSRKADPDDVKRILFNGEHTLAYVAEALGTSQTSVREAIKYLQKHGFNVEQFGDSWTIMRQQRLGHQDEFTLAPESGNRYRFGVISDTHYGSKILP